MIKILLIFLGIVSLGVISITVYSFLQRESTGSRLGIPDTPVEDFVLADAELLSATEGTDGTSSYPQIMISINIKSIPKYHRDNRATYPPVKVGDVVQVKKISTARIWPLEGEQSSSTPVSSSGHFTIGPPVRVDLSAKPEITIELLQTLIGKIITVSMSCSESGCYSGRIHKL